MAKYQLLACALMLHTLFWGMGAAWWTMPTRWKRWWPVLIPVNGLALQSAVVWCCARLGLGGANAYGLVSEILPAVLAVTAGWRMGARGWKSLARLWPVWLLMTACLAGMVWPLGKATHALTTASLGSCDAADYAAGARVFQEFGAKERGGFLGQTEVVSVRSSDNFFDFWVRLNHFTPSALMAHHGAVLRCQPHELAGVLTAVLLALGVPLVWWLARALFRHGPWESVGVAATYAASPLLWYAVYQVSPGQLLAAQAVGVLTWAGVARWGGARVGVLLAVGYWLLLGAYNFFVIVCLGPAVLFVSMMALRKRNAGVLLRWWGGMLLPLAVASVFAWPRVEGLVERFLLFSEYDFGWKIPVLTPEGWWGLVAGAGLEPWPWAARWLAAGVLTILLVAALVRAVRRAPTSAMLAVSCLLPAVSGYAFLAGRGAVLGTNASYDAYKWLSVFYPLVLPVLMYAVAQPWSRRTMTPRWRYLSVGAVAIVFACNALTAGRMAACMTQPPLIVDRTLRELAAVEGMSRVESVNMLVENFWERLWANAMLLRKPQYFPTHTYEGRLNTPLRGQWDLRSGILEVRTTKPEERIDVNGRYWLERAGAGTRLEARLGEGWHDEERLLRAGVSWRWTSGDAVIEVNNPREKAQRFRLRCEIRSETERTVRVAVDDGQERERTAEKERSVVDFGEMEISSGMHRIWMRAKAEPAPSGQADSRLLGVQVFRVEVEVLP